MSITSRRSFLKKIAAAATLFAAAPFSFARANQDFEMLVVGDSLIWGLGLEEKYKTYSLVKNWLNTELNQKVNLKVKAHSGATIFLHDDEARNLKKTDKPETATFYPEVSIAYPTLRTQIDVARNEYEQEGKSAESVNLVLLTGGIVDITVAGVLNPLGNEITLKKQIVQYCNEDMFRFLDESAKVFPNAIFVVVGYYPIFSPKTDTDQGFNAFLEAYAIPRPLKPFANNILTRPIFRGIKKKAIKRSRIWFEDSNREFQTAVNRLNTKVGKQRAVFVKTPLTEDNAVHTPDTMLFEMMEKGRVNDDLYDRRRTECKNVLSELRKSTGVKQYFRQCEIAAIGHPNLKGAKAYADSVNAILHNILQNKIGF